MDVIIFVVCILIVNVLAFVLYGIDKRRSQRKMYRIPENTLLWMARIGGGVGSWLGIKVFHHKTRHKRFMIIVPLWTVLWVAAIVYTIVKYYS